MGSTVSKVVVVVIDAGPAPQFVRALTQVCGTVPGHVEVVGVSARFPRLPSHLAERIDQVRVRHADELALAVDDLVTHEAHGTVVLAVSARALLRSGWYESATEQAAHVPHQIGTLGVGAPRLLRLMPGGVAPSRLTSYPLSLVIGVSEEEAAALVPAPRRVEADAAAAEVTAAH